MPLDIKELILSYFDELHIVCRADFNKIVQEKNLYIHHVKVPKIGYINITASEPTTGGLVW